VRGKHTSCSVTNVSGPSSAAWYTGTSYSYSQSNTPEVGYPNNVWYTTFRITINGANIPGGWTVTINVGGSSYTETGYVHWYSEQILSTWAVTSGLIYAYDDTDFFTFSAQTEHGQLDPYIDSGGYLSISTSNVSSSGFGVSIRAIGITNSSRVRVYLREVTTHNGFWHHMQSNTIYIDYKVVKKEYYTDVPIYPVLTIKNPSGGTGDFSMLPGSNATLQYTRSHSAIYGAWSSNNTSVASLSNTNTANQTTRINANAIGSATITVRSSEITRTYCYYSSSVANFSYNFTYKAASDTIKVTVSKYDSAVQIKRNGSTSNFTLTYGQSASLTASNGYGSHTWSANSSSIGFSTKSGTSTTITTWAGSGTATIQVTCAGNSTYNGSSDTIQVTSIKANNSITAYVNGSTSATVFVGDSGYISYNVYYNTGTVTYSSYDSGIAYVDSSGAISFNKAGTVILTANAPSNAYYNQAQSSVTVTVKKRAGSVTALYSGSSSNYQTRWCGEGNFYLTCTNNKGTVTWSSSNPSLASINNSGLVTVNTESAIGQNVTFTVNDSGNYMYEASSDTIIITLKAKQYAYLDFGIVYYNWSYEGNNVTQNIQWTPNISTYNLSYSVHFNGSYVPGATNVNIIESGNGVTDVRGTSAYTLHIIKPGTDQIQATWGGNYAYFGIRSGVITLNIAKCTQVMTLSGGGTRRYGNDSLNFNITNSFLYSLVNTNTINYSVTGNTNYITTSKQNESTLAVTVKQPGTIYVTASVAANTYWNAASSSQITVTVNKGDPGLEAYNGNNYISQTIIKTYTNSNFTLSYKQYLYNGAAASAPSVGWYTSNSNVISISNSGVCTVVGAGQCTVYAYSNANTYWNYKKSQNVNIVVNKFTPTITFNGYSISETNSANFSTRYGYYHPGPWKVNGHTVSSGLTYSCGLTVDTAGNVIASSAGNYACTVNFAGNANYNAVNNAKINFSVSKMYLKIINNPSSINITYQLGGTTFNVTHTIEPTYTGHVYWSANIDYTTTPTNGLLATVTHNNLGTSKSVQYTGILPGSTEQGIAVVVNETSNYYGVSTYIPVRVIKGSVTPSISNLTATYYHGRTDSMVATITDNKTGAFLPSDLITYSTTGTYTTVNSSGVINYTKAGGSDTITIKLSSKGLNYYNETSKTSILTINKGFVTIGWSPAPPTSLTYDYHNRTDVFGYTLKDTNSNTDLKPHNYCVSKISYSCTGIVSSVSGGTIKYSKAGTGSITVSFAGNDFYNNNSLSTNITLSKGTPTVNVGSVTFTYGQNNTTKTVNAKVYDKNGTNLPLTINLTPTTNSIDYITPTSGTSSFNTTIYFKNCSNVDYIKGSSVANDFWNAATHDPGGKITPSKGTVGSASITPVNSAPLTTIGSVTFTGTFTSTGFDHSNYIKWSSSSTNIADFQQTTNDTGKTQILTVKTKGKVTITATYESPYWNTKTVTTTFTAYQPISLGLTVNTSTGCNSTNLNIRSKTVAISGNKQVFIPYSDSTGLDNSTMMSKTTVTCPSVSIPLDIQSNGISFTLTEAMSGKAVTITTPVYRTSNYYEYSWLYDNYYYTTTTANQTNTINVVSVGRNTRKGKIANRRYIYTNYGTFDNGYICPTFSEITTGNRNINVKVAGDGNYASNQLVVETDIYREVY
jgi:hypothetical protein